MTYRVVMSAAADADMDRLFDHLIERELARDAGEIELAEHAMGAIRRGLAALRQTPFIYRKAGDDPFLRELIIPFGRTGYVALFEIVDDTTVVIAAVRHQREDDYH